MARGPKDKRKIRQWPLLILWRREDFRRGIIREGQVVLKAEFGQRAQSQTYGQRCYHRQDVSRCAIAHLLSIAKQANNSLNPRVRLGLRIQPWGRARSGDPPFFAFRTNALRDHLTHYKGI
jgi:hypothetical protein